MEDEGEEAVLFMERFITGLWVVVGTLILIIGSMGNVLVLLVVWCRRRVRYDTNGLYLACLALADILVLYVGLLRYLIVHMVGFNIRDSSVTACKVHLFLTYFSTQMSAWVLIHLTIERVAAVFMVHRVHVVFTLPRARVALVVNLIVIVLINIPYLSSFKLVKDRSDNSTKCGTDAGLEQLSDALDWVHLAVSSAIPFAIMTFANTAIVYRLHQERRKQTARRHSGRPAYPTCVLLTVTSVFIITTAPCAIYIGLVNNLSLYQAAENAEELGRLHLMGTSFALLSFGNHAINFLLYCLTGTKFRTEFINLIKRNKVNPIRLDTVNRPKHTTSTRY